jgi:hypothetical protein
VWAIPKSRIVKGKRISDPALPFDLAVLDYLPNAEVRVLDEASGALVPPRPNDMRLLRVEPRPESSGLEGAVDLAAAEVQVIDRQGNAVGQPILLAQHNLRPVRITVPADGQTRAFDLYLRFRRIYRGYALTLLDARHDRYLGTDIPKNFSSRVRLFDPSHGEDREVLIRMNEPMRYRGEAFYQYQMTAAAGQSVLQVVSNPGWLVPYVSCLMVALGLAVQFGRGLARFAGGAAS